MKKTFFTLLILVLGFAAVNAQRTITGRIVDENSEPLLGASILIKGTSMGTVSDESGMFTLSLPTNTADLVVSYAGYESKTVSVDPVSNNLLITMAQNLNLLDEVVVTALGIKRDERTLGYAVQSVDGNDVNNANVSSVVNALTGKAAGVQVTQSSGAAGGASRIVIRGQKNFNGNNEALIVVDGVRISNAENHSERSLGGVAVSNRGMDINPADVEDITVLKGAAASALYGAEGANGVILITTKKGQAQKGKINVDYGFTYGNSQINKNNEVQKKYLQGTGGAYRDPGTGQSGSWGPSADTMFWNGQKDYKWDKNGALVGASNSSKGNKFEPYDNSDIFFVNGSTIRNDIAVSGGDNIATYRFSFGHLSEKGIIPNNTFKKLNLGLSSTANFLNNKLKLSTGINFVRSGGQRVQQGSNVSGLMLGLMRTPNSFDNSNGNSKAWEDRSTYIFADGRQRNYRGGGGYDNPYWTVNLTPFEDDVNRVFGNFNASYEFNRWAVLGTTIGIDNYSDDRTQKYEINSRAFPSGRVQNETYLYRNFDAYLTLKGQGNLSEPISFGYTIGTNIFNDRQQVNSTVGSGLGFQGFMSLNNVSSVTTASSLGKSKNVGFFASADLGYKDFLYLTLTGRQDYLSSLIVPGKSYTGSDISVFYPSAALGFIFTELMNKNDVLNFGKLRLSYAGVGGGAPSPYLTATNYVVPASGGGTVNDIGDGWTNGVGYPFGGVSGFTLSSVEGAGSLQPSYSSEIEGGLDLRFLKQRLNLDISGYKRVSDNQITVVPVASSTGFQRAVINSGELRTNGIDVVLNTRPIVSNDLTWDFTINFSKWKTLVWSLPEGVNNQYLDGFTGTSVYNLGPEKDADGNVTKRYEYGQLFGGVWLRDANGNLVIGDDDSDYPGYPLADPIQKVLGNPNPDFLMSFINGFNYKGIGLDFQFDWKKGGDMWNGTRGAMVFFGTAKETENRGTTKVFEGVTGHYDADGNLVISSDKNTKPASLDQGWYQDNGGGFGVVAEDFIEDASFFRLTRLALGYTFNKKNFSGLPFQSIGVSLSGNNLWLSTKYTGIDPNSSLAGSSSNGQGMEYFNLPSTKSYFVNVNVKF